MLKKKIWKGRLETWWCNILVVICTCHEGAIHETSYELRLVLLWKQYNNYDLGQKHRDDGGVHMRHGHGEATKHVFGL